MDTTVASPRETAGERPATREPTKRRPTRWSGAAIAALVAAVVAAAVTPPVTFWAANRVAARQAQAPLVTPDDGGSSGSTAALARAVSPSVARVDVTTPQGQAEGSAVIYRSDGYLITNNHVVEQATDVTVTLPDGTSKPAKIVRAATGRHRHRAGRARGDWHGGPGRGARPSSARQPGRVDRPPGQ